MGIFLTRVWISFDTRSGLSAHASKNTKASDVTLGTHFQWSASKMRELKTGKKSARTAPDWTHPPHSSMNNRSLLHLSSDPTSNAATRNRYGTAHVREISTNHFLCPRIDDVTRSRGADPSRTDRIAVTARRGRCTWYASVRDVTQAWPLVT